MPVNHKVQEGECLSTIGKQYRFPDYRVIYEHPNNGPLKKKRTNPNILLPGDCVFVPDKQQKEAARVTDQRHIHEVKASTIHLRIRVLNEEEKPFASKKYELKVEDTIIRGVTGQDGMIDQLIATDARQADLSVCVDDDSDEEIFEATLAIGLLAPVDELTGVQARLNNLGYFCGAVDGVVGPLTTAAVKNFQKAHELNVDGVPGPATQTKLQSLYGC